MERYIYRAGNKPFTTRFFDLTVDKYRGSGYNEKESILRALDDFSKTHGIEWSEL